METTFGPAKPAAPGLREEGVLSSLPNFQGILRGKRRKGGKDREAGEKGKEEGKRKERKGVERGRRGGREKREERREGEKE